MTSIEQRAGATRSLNADTLEYARSGGKVHLGRVVFGWICLLGVAGTFLYSGAEKIHEPRQFVIAIKNYRIVPESFLNAQALYMPWLEVFGAIALLIPGTRRAGALVISAMLVMFIVAVSYAALYKGYNINCGCFGEASGKAGLKTLALDFTLLFATWAGVRFLIPPPPQTPANFKI